MMNPNGTQFEPNANDLFKANSQQPSIPSLFPQIPQRGILTLDQQLQLMSGINAMVKAGQFTSQLANAIFVLCQQLKTSGQILEQTHRNELNKVFVSLRQACCRDSGQLGTPCRLKIMELVELRAMHWRSNLAHTQYYVNRPEQQQQPTPQPLDSPPSFTPFVPGNASHPQPLFADHSGVLAQPVAQPPPPNSFYLIPAAGGWVPPLINGGLVPTIPSLPTAAPSNLVFASSSAPPPQHETVLMRTKSLTKRPTAAKPAQFREEMTIRNADSGKIMGVKGRRVALVEQLSNSVISFQKVDPKSRERTLTITASSQEAIEHAKILIEQTIKRNVSPNRGDNGELIMGLPGEDDEDEDESEENGISIETTQDGTLKLCCSDPQVLQAAQQALSEYLRVRTRQSAEERELKKERRRSMPLRASTESASSTSNAGANSVRTPIQATREWRSLAGSTPNLAEPEKPVNSFGVTKESQQQGQKETLKYTREKLMELSLNDDVETASEIRYRVQQTVPEILKS